MNITAQKFLPSPEAAKRFSEETFFGYDFDSTMLRIGSMNMMLHGVENPRIENRDSLSEAHSHIESKYQFDSCQSSICRQFGL